MTKHNRSTNDFYPTSDEYALKALIHVMDYARHIRVLEPCAGEMHLVRQMEALGFSNIVTNDLYEYDGCRCDTYTDFLTPSDEARAVWGDVRAIITNPPYGASNQLMNEFVSAALGNFPRANVAMLCDATWDMGVSRFALTRDNHRFVGKVALCNRLIWFGGRPGTKWHAWYVWGPVDTQKRDSGQWGYPSIAYTARKDFAGDK